MNPQNLPERIHDTRTRIAAAAARCGRSVDSITLLAVSKGQPAQTVAAAAAAGLTEFGESYLQEALAKQDALAAATALQWHFIGRLQANKTRPVAERFAWVHGVDRLRIAQRLSEQRPYHAGPLNVCLQVNIAAEQSKAGAAPEEVPELVRSMATLPRLKLRGLMCIPPEESDPERQRMWFAKLRRLQEALNTQGAGLDTLSMGMSADLEAAVLEGSTCVRIGTALFGPRP
ncbi:MAG TPA: YggS family pyridoxal phosphate-dependent enzyme [Steroidobacteraceae bacterium]|jgi:pyridoxal phosphate enzyme (YggS family)|nr:YggS family pyridoxal phosphate-dependent enzyme [Steroidobacteraceae bacterium]